MSRQTVRSAVVNYFAPPRVNGLNKVFSSMPKRIEGGWFRYGQPAGTPSGAVAIVQIVSESEERIAIGGEHDGKKWVHYDVQLELYQHSVRAHSEDAMADFDVLVDNVKDALRADRRLSDYPVIFEAGEKYLLGEYGEPKVLGDGSTEIWGAVRFEVSEVISA
jgi:hypothetical protein